MRKGLWTCSAVFACILATAAAGNPPEGPQVPADDLDPGEGDSTPLPFPLPEGSGLCGRSAVAQASPGTLAIVVIRGPMNSTRFSYEIWNYAGDSISSVYIDGFDALGGQGLLFSRVTASHATEVGSVRIDYPRIGAGRGPIILGFSGFGSGRCAAVDAEASTLRDAALHGRVLDAVGARIQVVFEGGLRGNGEVVLCGSNGRFFRDIPCHPGDAVASISGSRTVQLRLSQ